MPTHSTNASKRSITSGLRPRSTTGRPYHRAIVKAIALPVASPIRLYIVPATGPKKYPATRAVACPGIGSEHHLSHLHENERHRCEHTELAEPLLEGLDIEHERKVLSTDDQGEHHREQSEPECDQRPMAVGS